MPIARRRSLAPAAAAIVLVVGATTAVAEQPDGIGRPELPPGCTTDRVAVAHHSEGRKLAAQPPHRPLVCGMHTGFAGGETRIEVTKSGAVIVAPAGTGDFSPSLASPEERPQTILAHGGVAVSHDNGGSWKLSLPFGMSWHQNDLETYVDRDTGRFFWAVMFKNPPTQAPRSSSGDPDIRPETRAPAAAAHVLTSHLLTSPDDGETWTYSQACCEIVNGAGVITTRAYPGELEPVGYPNVAYYCWRSSQTFPGKPPEGVCSRSRDGGATWELRGYTHRGGVPVHPDVCSVPGWVGATPNEDSETAGLPAAAPDGSLYMVLGCKGRTYLARSTDSAATWPVARELPYRGELRIDAAGNMYLLRSAAPNGQTSGTIEEHTKLLLSVSGDEGRTWSREMNVLAPGVVAFEAERTALYGGVSCCTNWFYDVHHPGHVAIAYSGRASPQVTTLDGYITATRNALDVLGGGEPVFYSGTVNDRRQPLKYFTGFPRGANVMTNQVGADIGPDGSPWVAFTEDCGPTRDSPRCVDQHNQSRVVAGRLAWVHHAARPK